MSAALRQRTLASGSSPSFYDGRKLGEVEQALLWTLLQEDPQCTSPGPFSSPVGARNLRGFPGSAGLWPAPEAGETPALPGPYTADSQKLNDPDPLQEDTRGQPKLSRSGFVQ